MKPEDRFLIWIKFARADAIRGAHQVTAWKRPSSTTGIVSLFLASTSRNQMIYVGKRDLRHIPFDAAPASRHFLDPDQF